MPYNSRADVFRLLAERYDTKSKVKLGGFQSQLQASYVPSHTEELWYNETVSVYDNIYIFDSCANHVIVFRKRTLIERLNGYIIFLSIYPSSSFLYIIKHPSSFCQHLFHHLKVLMKAH